MPIGSSKVVLDCAVYSGRVVVKVQVELVKELVARCGLVTTGGSDLSDLNSFPRHHGSRARGVYRVGFAWALRFVYFTVSRTVQRFEPFVVQVE